MNTWRKIEMVIESMEAFGKKDTEDNYLRVNKLIDGNTYSLLV